MEERNANQIAATEGEINLLHGKIMIEVLKYPSEFCFVGNPVVFEVKSDNQHPVDVVVRHKDKQVSLAPSPSKSDVGYSCEIDVSDVLKSFFDGGLPIYGETTAIAAYPELVRNCTVTIAGNVYNIQAMDGGVSDDAINELLDTGDDMFSYRLMNAERSLLFTTRTNSPHISLRESELFPFVFLHPGKPITFMSPAGNAIAQQSLPKGTPCLMDIAFVRRTFMEVYNELPTYLTVMVDGADSFYITINKSVYSEDMHWIVFKNSLGAYESIEITGKAINTPILAESKPYLQHIRQGLFGQKRDRIELQEALTIHTGYKNQEELNFLMDMVTTDMAYLVYPNKKIVEVIPSIESPKFDARISQPTSLEIKLTKQFNSKYHSPAIDQARPGAWIWDGIWDDYAYWFDAKQILDYKED